MSGRLKETIKIKTNLNRNIYYGGRVEAIHTVRLRV